MSNEEKPKEYPIQKQEGDLLRPIVRVPEPDMETYRLFENLIARAQPASTEQGSGGFSLRDILYILFRHKKKIIAIFLFVSLATVYYLASGTSSYKSEAKIFIRGDRNTIAVDPTAESNSFLRSDKGGDVQSRSEMALLASAAVAEKAVDIIGLENLMKSEQEIQIKANSRKTQFDKALDTAASALKKPIKGFFKLLHMTQPPLSPREKAVAGIIGNLEVAPSSGGSAVLNVEYTAADPKMAQKILDAVLEGYLQTHIATHSNPVAPDFFEKRAGQVHAKLKEKEEALDRRRKELNIASMSTEKELLLNQLNLLETRISETAAEMSSSQARINTLRKTLSGAKSTSDQPAAIMDAAMDPETARLSQEVVQLKMQEMDLRTKYKDGYKDLEDVRNKIKQLDTLIAGRKTSASPAIRAADPMRQGLSLQHETERALLDGLMARESRLTAEANEVRGRLRQLTSHEQELERLQREVTIVENEYQLYTKSIQTSQISQMLDQKKVGNVSILQHATNPATTVRTQKKTLALLAFGIFMGLAGGLGVAFVLEFINHSVKTSEDIEKNLGLPVLVSIPVSKHHRPRIKEEVA